MHINLKQNDASINSYHFRRGPVYIGRQLGSQVFLPDRKVSRQHAVIYNTDNDQWFIEDLDTPNKTYLNDNAIHKSILKSGDKIRIGPFEIELNFEEDATREASVHLDDTLVNESPETQVIVRRVDKEGSPVIRIHPQRIGDFQEFCKLVCKHGGREQFFDSAVRLLIKQLSAANAWIGLTEGVGQAISYQYGRRVSTERISYDKLVLKDKIIEAIKDCSFILIPKMPLTAVDVKIRSAIIVPIIVENKKISGVIYIDNSREHEHYNMPDVDYIILISKMIGTCIASLSD